MLNGWFILFVTLFVLIIYAIFAILRKKTTINYLGFILLIIATFLLVFSLQIGQQVLTELQIMNADELSSLVGYPIYLLFLPIIISALLLFINLYRAFRRIRQWQMEK